MYNTYRERWFKRSVTYQKLQKPDDKGTTSESTERNSYQPRIPYQAKVSLKDEMK